MAFKQKENTYRLSVYEVDKNILSNFYMLFKIFF